MFISPKRYFAWIIKCYLILKNHFFKIKKSLLNKYLFRLKIFCLHYQMFLVNKAYFQINFTIRLKLHPNTICRFWKVFPYREL